MSKDKKELTMQDLVEGDLLKNLNKKIAELESQKSSLENEIDKKREELSKMIQEVNKEIDQKIQKASEGTQTKIFEANELLKKAELKLKTAEKRESESLVIEKQHEDLNKAIKDFDVTKKAVDGLRVSCLEKEKKAELLIEQYSKKLQELGEEPIVEIKKDTKETKK